MNLPESWVLAYFGDICQVQGGYAFKSKDYKSKGVLLVRISNLIEGKVSSGNKAVFLPTSLCDEFPSFYLQKGDILIAMSGATTGKMAIFDLDLPAILNQRVGRFSIISPNWTKSSYVRYLVKNVVVHFPKGQRKNWCQCDRSAYLEARSCTRE